MSKYNSIGLAIEVLEKIQETLGRHEKLTEAIGDLKDILKDVRYGGEWNGDYEVICETLARCEERDCIVCPYRKMRDAGGQCVREIKRDAKHCIRSLVKERDELGNELDRLLGKEPQKKGI